MLRWRGSDSVELGSESESVELGSRVVESIRVGGSRVWRVRVQSWSG